MTDLDFGDFVFAEPELFEACETFEVIDFLDCLNICFFGSIMTFLRTRIRLAPSSRFRRFSSPSSPSILEMLFCTK